MASISPLSFLSPFNNTVSSKQSIPNRHRVPKVITMACNNSNQTKSPRNSEKEESKAGNRRRDVLIGLGALYGAATITGGSSAHATEASKGSVKFPITLDSSVSVAVKRPKKSRSKKEKEEEEEVLVVDGIQFDRSEAVKFDVVLNCEDDDDINQIGPKNREFAGSFVSLPHGNRQGNSKRMSTCFKLGLTDLLQDLEAEDDDSVFVTLVPKIGTGLVTVNGIKIELVAD